MLSSLSFTDISESIELLMRSGGQKFRGGPVWNVLNVLCGEWASHSPRKWVWQLKIKPCNPYSTITDERNLKRHNSCVNRHFFTGSGSVKTSYRYLYNKEAYTVDFYLLDTYSYLGVPMIKVMKKIAQVDIPIILAPLTWRVLTCTKPNFLLLYFS